MKRLPILVPLFALLLAACDQAEVRKQAYEKGFADGKAAAAAAVQAVPKATPYAATAGALGGTPRPADAQVRRVLPNSQLQGSALDQRPAKR